MKTESPMLSRESILASTDLKTETVTVREWGGDVIVSTMTGVARDEWESSLVIRDGAKSKPNLANMRARLVAATLVDEAGKRIFSAKDIEALGEKSGAALERVCRVAQKLNGLTNEDLEEAAGN